jgi:MoxR-like ATPase/Tfp pilus assembly protein PilZ
MADQPTQASERALEGGSYEVIRRRLLERATELSNKAEALNQKRKQLFGGGELTLVATERVRTENNCTPRDVVSVGGQLLFGFEVFIGLKTETRVQDVVSLFNFEKSDSGYDLSQQPFEGPGAFLADPEFDKQFREAFRYYKDARLLQLERTETRLLVAVQIGASVNDAKIFRFAIDAKGRVTFMDARGEDDHKTPRAHPFEWTQARREDQVAGPHPHVNVLNEVFVETIGGDLTVKIENNTQDGLGIYREPVDDPNQTLDDADIAYARVSGLILLRIKPFREQKTRYLVYNPRTQEVLRVDALGVACVELPEDHGLIFPGGYYLTTGEYKLFDGNTQGLAFRRSLSSPNGEDVMYVFYRPAEGEYELLPYNLIAKEVKNPIRCHGFSLFPDGTMLVFRAEGEPTRLHPVQIWSTPFTTAEFAASAPTDGSYLAKVGNAALVSGISELLSLRKLVSTEKPTRRTYDDLVTGVRRAIDTHYWLGHAEMGGLLDTLKELQKSSQLIVEEFEKQLQLERKAREAIQETEKAQAALLEKLRPTDLGTVEAYLSGLSELKRQRGTLITLKEVRAIDVARVEQLEQAVAERFGEVSRACVDFFLAENAFQPLLDRLEAVVVAVGAAHKTTELVPLRKELDAVHEGLSLLSETIAGLPIDDPTVRTKILDGTSSAFAQQNRARAVLDGRQKELGTGEGRTEFGVQFKLLGQSVTSALALATTPEACDEQLGRLMLQLEELEGRFGELDEFSVQLTEKREEVLDAVNAKRQLLVEERQRRAQSLATAAERVLGGIVRRAQQAKTAEELNGYFASDAMVHKLSELSAQLRQLGDSVRADELDSKLKSAKQNALRILRDKTDLLEDDGNVIRFGQHRFSVNTRPLELVIVPRNEVLNVHLTGTDFFEPISNPLLDASRELWDQELVSETREVYRGEFLAVSLLLEAEAGVTGRTLAELEAAARSDKLGELVRQLAGERIDEGYERGVHDHDATLILEKLLSLLKVAGALRFSPRARAVGWLFWQGLAADRKNLIERRARSAGRLREKLGDGSAEQALAQELAHAVKDALEALGLASEAPMARFAAAYLVSEVAQERVKFTESGAAAELRREFLSHLEQSGAARGLEEDLRVLSAHPPERLRVALSYVDAFLRGRTDGAELRLELAARAVCDGDLEFQVSSAIVDATVVDLLGSHPLLASRSLKIVLPELLERLQRFIEERAPRFRAFRSLKTELAGTARERLRLSEYLPRVLTSFVRNRLIDEVYLPLVGANLAKQLGAAGAAKRTDQMGLLLLVSPPGYGKTTLMEYVASKLGLVFMKVNGPALGTEVHSLDPSEAPNATARQEVEKINLALEMGNNVMLYLDDIQHTHPELLQKFISLCDAQRRIEGVWNGRTRTYDLRGKKFCIVMAGNPYTESGARFQIPDMLANRADTYNLGDILEGKQEAFALSYLENALTSNAVLAPLAGRDASDVHKLIAMARGEDVPLSELSHGYSSAEAQELVELFKRLLKVQRVLLSVNLEYIASASRDDRYRTEPPFKLQGSYRNMAKLTEKVVSAMNDEELERLIDDHYASEAQTLTKGAEQNLLKLAEMRGRLTPQQSARWIEIKEAFGRVQRMGGGDADPVARVTGTLSGLDMQLKGIREAIVASLAGSASRPAADPGLSELAKNLSELGRPRLEVRLGDERNDGLIPLFSQQTELLKQALGVLGRRGAEPADAAIPQKLAELTTLLARLSGQIEAGTGSARRVDVELDTLGPTNLYRPLSATDLFTGGGIFVATYEKPPPLGAEVRVSLRFPAGSSCELSGNVAWVRDQLGEDAPPGFGVRFGALSEEARQLVQAYSEAREPMLYDD